MTNVRPAYDLHADAARILTQATGRQNPDGSTCDFADFLTQALASTAANLGGPSRLLAGRPGSWEAELLGSLVYGTMSDDPDAWLRYRTEPVVVSLNVAELIEDSHQHPGLLGLGDALTACDDRHETTNETDAYKHLLQAITARYTETYREYGERFAHAVRAAAATMGRLQVPVEVRADTDPSSRWWAHASTRNPDPIECLPIVAELWRRAHEVLPLPNVDIRVERASVASSGGPATSGEGGDQRSATQQGRAR